MEIGWKEGDVGLSTVETGRDGTGVGGSAPGKTEMRGDGEFDTPEGGDGGVKRASVRSFSPSV